MFCQSKNICDFLIVALHEDPSIERPSKMKPILSSAERKKILNSIKYIDLVIPYSYEKDLYDLLLKEKPDIRLLGEDYKDRQDYTGYGLCPEVYFFTRNHGWSTTKFKNKIYEQIKIQHNKGETK